MRGRCRDGLERAPAQGARHSCPAADGGPVAKTDDANQRPTDARAALKPIPRVFIAADRVVPGNSKIPNPTAMSKAL